MKKIISALAAFMIFVPGIIAGASADGVPAAQTESVSNINETAGSFVLRAETNFSSATYWNVLRIPNLKFNKRIDKARLKENMQITENGNPVNFELEDSGADGDSFNIIADGGLKPGTVYNVSLGSDIDDESEFTAANYEFTTSIPIFKSDMTAETEQTWKNFGFTNAYAKSAHAWSVHEGLGQYVRDNNSMAVARSVTEPDGSTDLFSHDLADAGVAFDFYMESSKKNESELTGQTRMEICLKSDFDYLSGSSTAAKNQIVIQFFRNFFRINVMTNGTTKTILQQNYTVPMPYKVYGGYTNPSTQDGKDSEGNNLFTDEDKISVIAETVGGRILVYMKRASESDYTLLADVFNADAKAMGKGAVLITGGVGTLWVSNFYLFSAEPFALETAANDMSTTAGGELRFCVNNMLRNVPQTVKIKADNGNIIECAADKVNDYSFKITLSETLKYYTTYRFVSEDLTDVYASSLDDSFVTRKMPRLYNATVDYTRQDGNIRATLNISANDADALPSVIFVTAIYEKQNDVYVMTKIKCTDVAAIGAEQQSFENILTPDANDFKAESFLIGSTADYLPVSEVFKFN